MNNAAVATREEVDLAFGGLRDSEFAFRLAEILHEPEAADKVRIIGLERAIELADMLRAGAPIPEGMNNIEGFLESFPEGSTVESLLVRIRAFEEDRLTVQDTRLATTLDEGGE